MTVGQGNRQTLTADGQNVAKIFAGPVRLVLSGGFGGGTAVLRSLDPSGVAINVVNGSFTAVTDTLFDFPENSLNVLDVDISGSTTPTLAVWIQGRRVGE